MSDSHQSRQSVIARLVTAMLVLGCAAAGVAEASPIPFQYMAGASTGISTGGSSALIQQNKSQGNFDSSLTAAASDTFVDASTGRNFSVSGSANLSTGSLHISNTGKGGPGGNASNSVTDASAMLLDKFTVLGNFSTPITIPFTAQFDGTWDSSSTPLSSQVQQFIGALWISDPSISFTQDDWFPTPGPFFGSTNPLYKNVQIVSLPQTTSGPQNVSITIPGQLTLSGSNPQFAAWLFMEAFLNSDNPNAVWNGNFLNTGSLSFNFSGLNVVSASGSFPGTSAATAAVPEPGSLLLLGSGLIGITTLVRRRARVCSRRVV